MIAPSHQAGKLAFFLVFLALQSAIFAQTVQAQTVQERVVFIATALRNRDFDHALQLVENAIHAFPNNPQLRMFEGLAYMGKGDQNAALASYQAALKISPDYLPALEGAAQLEYEQGRPDAVPHLEHVLRLRPQDPTSHAMLAVLAYKKGDCASAAKHFAESGPALHSQPGALQEYGACLLKLKETDRAVEIFQELLSSNPDDPRARRGLAAVQLSVGQPKDALATLQPLLDSNPEVSTMQLAAAVHEANKDTPNAVKILREAIVKDPRNTALYVDFAEIALNHQSFQTGIEMIDAGLKQQPQAADLYLARGVLYVQTAAYDKAEDDFQKAEQLDPQQGLSAAAQGMVAEEKHQSDPDQALTTVRDKLAGKPGDAFLWYLQAAILSQEAPEPGSDDFNRGLASAQKAVALDPSLTAAHNVLAKYYLDSGQYALAAKECRLVLEREPADQTALYHLVMALRKTGGQAEIPDLLKRLAKARQDATREEGERNRYKLVVVPPEASR
jgi:tetratricopeptide (TPR) repeat protein